MSTPEASVEFAPAPHAATEPEHVAQFYDDDTFLLTAVEEYIGGTLIAGGCGILVATSEHIRELEKRWRAQGLDLIGARQRGRYVALDANATLERLLLDGWPKERRFLDMIEPLVVSSTRRHPAVRVFGEMVALLCRRGRHGAAIQLEELWNRLGKRYRFSLMCAYPMNSLGEPLNGDALVKTCAAHSRIAPPESHSRIDAPAGRLIAITELRQKARALELEVQARKAVERTLARRERELSDFLENADEGLNKLDADGRILWANKAMLDSLGYSQEEYVGHRITEFRPRDAEGDDGLTRLFAAECIHDMPLSLRCRDGSMRHFVVNANGFSEDGKVLYTRCFMRDVTRDKLAEAAARAADRRKDEFLATLAHELRNPLAPIRNAVEIMRVADADRAATANARQLIERQLKQLVRLIDDLLDVSRITQGRLELRKERMNLAIAVQMALETSRPLIESKQHHLEIRGPREPLFVDADATRLAQVFGNLINNSAKYSRPQSTIIVALRAQGDSAIVTVSDTGAGIPSEILPRVFDMFERVDPGPDASQDGLGIGLTLVKHLVELHGGTVEAHSEGPELGSAFTISLPLWRSSVEEELATPHPASAPHPCESSVHRVLVVDDNKDAATSLAMMLAIDGHEVRRAYDGIEALEVAEEFQPEVVLLDIGMPRLDGYGAARELRKRPWAKELLLVAVTGWGNQEDKRRTAEAGFDRHLVKPVEPEVMRQLVEELRL